MRPHAAAAQEPARGRALAEPSLRPRRCRQPHSDAPRPPAALGPGFSVMLSWRALSAAIRWPRCQSFPNASHGLRQARIGAVFEAIGARSGSTARPATDSAPPGSIRERNGPAERSSEIAGPRTHLDRSPIVRNRNPISDEQGRGELNSGDVRFRRIWPGSDDPGRARTIRAGSDDPSEPSVVDHDEG